MRARVTYVQRRAARRNLIGVQALHCSPRLGIHDTPSALTVCKRPEREGQESRERSNALQAPQASEEPAAKRRRTKDSPNSRLDTASVGTTRRLLQGVLTFFRVREATPPLQKTSSLSGLSLTRSLRRFFVGSHPPEDQQHQQDLQQQHILQQQQQAQPQRQQHLHNQQQQAKLQQEQLRHQQQHLHQQQQVKIQHWHQEEQLQDQQQHLHQQQQVKIQHQQQHPQPQHKKQSQQKKKQQQSLPAVAAEPQGETSTEVVPKKAAKTTKKTPFLRRSRPNDGNKQVRVSYEEFHWFTQLTELPEVESFLKRDICCRYADKYLLAIVFTYFARAGLKREEYTKENFFAALYLAHDMEEDEEDFKYEVFPWALGSRWRKTYQSLLKVRDDLFFAIHCRAVVSKRGCDQVMGFQPDCWLWRRERPAYHGGAMREYLRHPSDNGRPRGPDKSPLQCVSCLEREQENSENSYIIYHSDSTNSGDSFYLRRAVTTEHKEDEASAKHKDGDSGFETFLLEPNSDANSLGAP